jgi:prostaglandin-endoperoxide synthase 2
VDDFVFSLVARFPIIVRIVSAIPFLRRLISNIYIKRVAGSADPRPRPFSLASSYTSWKSLTDRTYTGRHLPEAEGERNLPDIEKVVELWHRKDNREIPSVHSSLLFSFFAQWFTDSFLRTDLFDRRKNSSNHQIDLCQIYGLREELTNILRSHKDGKLRHQFIDGEMYPAYLFDPERTTSDNWVFASEEFERLHPRPALEFIFQGVPEDRLRYMFAVGLEHGNSSIGYTVLNTIFLREHNRICDILKNAHADWDDERLFQTARNIMIVLLIKVVLRDYIGHFNLFDFIVDPSPDLAEKQRWYRTNWITMEFNLLYRWHSMVPEKFVLGDKRIDVDEFRNNTPLVMESGLEAVISAASRQRTGRIGLHNTPDFFFQPFPIGADVRSVMERTVAMGRDARLRSYNDYREAFSFPRLGCFEELTSDPELLTELKTLYHDNIDDLEWHVGIFAEEPGEGFILGDLMTRMVGFDAFTHALTNPLMSIYVHNERTFTREGLNIIEQTGNISDLVKRNVQDSRGVDASFKHLKGHS